MPRMPSAALVLRRMTCSRCAGIKLIPQRFCDDCMIDINERKENSELTTAGNWNLRTEESKRASYVGKRKKQLVARLSELDFELNFLQWRRRWRLDDAEVINKKICSLSRKQERIRQQYNSLERETKIVARAKQTIKQPKNRKEGTVKGLEGLLAGLRNALG